MENEKSNLLAHLTSYSRSGLIFLYITVIGLAVALVCAGTLVITVSIQRHNHLERAKKIIYKPTAIVSASSNEKANPGVIAFYLNNRIAGGLLEDGSYSATSQAPEGGPLAIYFLNPSAASQPISVRFPSQKITIKDTTGELTICTPAINAKHTLWVDKNGTTYLDSILLHLARSC